MIQQQWEKKKKIQSPFLNLFFYNADNYENKLYDWHLRKNKRKQLACTGSNVNKGEKDHKFFAHYRQSYKKQLL